MKKRQYINEEYEMIDGEIGSDRRLDYGGDKIDYYPCCKGDDKCYSRCYHYRCCEGNRSYDFDRQKKKNPTLAHRSFDKLDFFYYRKITPKRSSYNTKNGLRFVSSG